MNILQMSIAASILILAIVVIRALAIHKLPKRTFLLLWIVALIRLLIPFSIPLPFNATVPIESPTEVFTEAPEAQIISALPRSETLTFFETTSVPGTDTQISAILIIWVAGVIVCALFFIVTHLRCLKDYKAALPVESDFVNGWLQEHKIRRSVQARQSDRICAPMTYGIWRPIILFPKATDWQNIHRLRYVLTHELIHIQRFDILLKWLLAAALCIHWFNPFVWGMYILANRDIELFCDEKVVRTLGETTKSAYALTLIGLGERNSGFPLLNSHFAKNAIEERINAIMKIKKTTIFALIMAVILVAGATTVALAASITPSDDLPETGAAAEIINSDSSITDMDSRVTLMKLNHTDYTTVVSYLSFVDPRPGLEFYIEGEDIAKIELSCENEYIYIVDYAAGQSVEHPGQKVCTLTFPEDFDAYDEIEYRWIAWDLYEWASADNFSHFQGMADTYNFASEQEKLEAAAGMKTAAGHILLDDYPEDKLDDCITIAITDRQGNSVTKTIAINIRNNEIGQTFVTANLFN